MDGVRTVCKEARTAVIENLTLNHEGFVFQGLERHGSPNLIIGDTLIVFCRAHHDVHQLAAHWFWGVKRPTPR